MVAKVIVLCSVIALVRGGFITSNQLQSNSYASAVNHPAVAVARPAVIAHAPAATSSVNVQTALPQYLTAAPAAAVSAQVSVPQYNVQAAVPVVQTRIEPYDPNPHYTFAYEVNDPHTGDSKNQHESRSGDAAVGQYSVTDPDGYRRTVDYSADHHTGFTAVVRRTPIHPVPVTIQAPVHSTYVTAGH